MPASIIERARRTRLGQGELALWNLGGAGFVVRSAGALLLIDPFIGEGHPPEWERALPAPFGPQAVGEVDAVLATHEHDDHADPAVFAAMVAHNPHAAVYGPPSATAIARRAGLPEGRTHTLRAEATVQIKDIQMTALEMRDLEAPDALGYLLECGPLAVVHCGDSLYFPGFAELAGARQGKGIDALCVSVGTNPPGQTFYMDEADAARAARDSGARTLIPMHFNLWQRTLIDPRRVATVTRWYAPGTAVMPAHYLRKITLRGE